MSNEKFIKIVLATILAILGFVLISVYTNIGVAFGVFLMIWANNIE